MNFWSDLAALFGGGGMKGPQSLGGMGAGFTGAVSPALDAFKNVPGAAIDVNAPSITSGPGFGSITGLASNPSAFTGDAGLPTGGGMDPKMAAALKQAGSIGEKLFAGSGEQEKPMPMIANGGPMTKAPEGFHPQAPKGFYEQLVMLMNGAAPRR